MSSKNYLWVVEIKECDKWAFLTSFRTRCEARDRVVQLQKSLYFYRGFCIGGYEFRITKYIAERG